MVLVFVYSILTTCKIRTFPSAVTVKQNSWDALDPLAVPFSFGDASTLDNSIAGISDSLVAPDNASTPYGLPSPQIDDSDRESSVSTDDCRSTASDALFTTQYVSTTIVLTEVDMIIRTQECLCVPNVTVYMSVHHVCLKADTSYIPNIYRQLDHPVITTPISDI